MGYVKWSYETLNHFCGDVFKAFGFTEEESNQIKDVLLTADLYGIESHGMQRMVRYHKGIEKGTIHPQAKPEVVFETPISAVIDGHNGMGQLISVYAMKKAIEKAKKTGVGIVTVRESNHFGIAGYYAKMACDEGTSGNGLHQFRGYYGSYVWQKSHAWIKPNRSSYAGRPVSVFL